MARTDEGRNAPAANWADASKKERLVMVPRKFRSELQIDFKSVDRFLIFQIVL